MWKYGRTKRTLPAHSAASRLQDRKLFSSRNLPAGKIVKHAVWVYHVAMEPSWKFIAGNGIEVVLRLATPADSGGIINTIRSPASERSYALMEQFGKTDEDEKKHISAMGSSRNLLIIASVAEEIIGVLCVLQADSGCRPETAHGGDVGMHIKEGYRGLGIGSQMLKYAIEWARENDFSRLEACLFTVNMGSLNVFRKAGFDDECCKSKKIRIGTNFVNEVCVGKWLE
jgi:GNAT superfamily N-acetyltransferase